LVGLVALSAIVAAASSRRKYVRLSSLTVALESLTFIR
jgi:hypothetical protein